MENTKKKKKPLGLILIIIIVSVIILAFNIIKNNEKDVVNEENLNSSSGEILEGNISIQEEEENEENVKQNVVPQGIAIPGWEEIKIPANTTQVTVDFYNPEENLGLYYLTFELRLLNNTDEGYEVLYKSDLIKPGQHVQDIELTKALTSGEYETIIHVQPYKMDEYKTPTNNADMKTMLVVK